MRLKGIPDVMDCRGQTTAHTERNIARALIKKCIDYGTHIVILFTIRNLNNGMNSKDFKNTKL
jgi:hypothetical protein